MQILVVLSIIGLAVLIQLLVFRRFALKNLSAEIEFSSPIAHCGDTVTMKEHVRNEKRLPLSMVIIRFEAPREFAFPDLTNTSLSDYYYREDLITLGAWKEHIRHIKVKCKMRGYFEFRRLSVITTDLLLITRMSAHYPTTSTLTVFPRPIKHHELERLFVRLLGDRTHRLNPLTDPFAFSGIRDYLPTDNLRAVNWKSSAKHQKLMVNTFISSIRPEITILLNVTRYSPKRDTEFIETAISICYSLSLRCIQNGLPIALYSNSSDIITDRPIRIEHGSSLPHGNYIAHALARISLNKKEHPSDSLFNEKNIPSALSRIVVISPNFDSAFQKLLLDQIKKNHSLLWIIPRSKHVPDPPLLAELQEHTILWRTKYEYA